MFNQSSALLRYPPWLASLVIPLLVIFYVIPKLKPFHRFISWFVRTCGIPLTTGTRTILITPSNATEERVYPLTAMDCLQASIPPIAFCFFYEQTIDDARFQLALEQTLIHFPLLAGRMILNTKNLQESPIQVKVHPTEGGAHLEVTDITRPYSRKDDQRWFPYGTGTPFPAPHEPCLGYGPLLRVKITHVHSSRSSVVSFGFCHAVMDATTVGAFLKTLTAHFNRLESSKISIDDTKMNDSKFVPSMKLDRVTAPCVGPETEPLECFTMGQLIRSLPKLVVASTLTKTINLTVETSELQRLKGEFLQAAQGEEVPWVSTYEMVGVLLLRAFAKVSNLTTGTTTPDHIECRCVVDPRARPANSHATSSHPGNVSEMPSIKIPLDHLMNDDHQWQSQSLQAFHTQLRSSLVDSTQMTELVRRANASLAKGRLHTTGGRTMSSLLFARNILEDHVTSYNSWLHMDWLGPDMATLGGAAPQHFQVTPGMCCVDMFWVFPRTPTQVTIRTTLPRGKAKRFLQELSNMNVSYQLQ